MRLAVPLATAIMVTGVLMSIVLGKPALVVALVFTVMALVVGALTDLGLFD